MKKYLSIVLLLSFVKLPLAQADTAVQNDNTGGEVAYTDHKGVDGTDQLNSLRRLSYCRTDFSLYMSRPGVQIELEEDTARSVIEEEQEEATTTESKWGRAAVGCLVGAAVLVVLGILFMRDLEEWFDMGK